MDGNPTTSQAMAFQIQTALVAIATPELEQLIKFYTQVFGQEPAVDIPGVYGEFNLVGLRLGLFKPGLLQQAEFANSARGTVSVCLEVDKLEVAIAELAALGCASGEVLTASHGREVYAYDPAGNRLILHQSI